MLEYKILAYALAVLALAWAAMSAHQSAKQPEGKIPAAVKYVPHSADGRLY